MTNVNPSSKQPSGFVQATATDWRKQIRINERKTLFVIVMFVAIYILVGLVIDLYLHPELNKLGLLQAGYLLITLQVIPIATFIFGGVAILSLLITFALHDKIILFGTDHREITANNAQSIAEKQLYNVIEELKIAAGLRYMPRVYIIDAPYMNAFASGYSEKSALVAITRGLLEKLERSELQAVMAHELSHIRHHDIKLTLMATVLSNIMLIAIDFLFYNMMFSDRRRREDNNGLVMVIILLRYLLPLLTVILLLYLSRTREYLADAGSVELTRDNTPLAKALLKISSDHQAHQDEYARDYSRTPHEDLRFAAYIFEPSQMGVKLQNSIASMFSTHPLIKDRLKALGWKKAIDD